MEKQKSCMRKITGIAIAAVLVIAAFGILPAAAYELSDWNHINITVADNNIRINEYGDNTYFVNFSTPGGGLNATHITDDYSYPFGQVKNISLPFNAASGTFYITDVGNRSFQDDIILLVAVNPYGDNEDAFIRLSASGYYWTPTGTGFAPPRSAVNYGTTLSTTSYNEDDYLVNSTYVIEQNWKPASYPDYQIFSGDSDLYNLFFVDTWAGIFTNVSNLNTLNYNGSVKIDYEISGFNPGSKFVFNAYAWNKKTWDSKTNQFKYDVSGVRWTNDVNGSKTNENVYRVNLIDSSK